jgi:hypothetical protein
MQAQYAPSKLRCRAPFVARARRRHAQTIACAVTCDRATGRGGTKGAPEACMRHRHVLILDVIPWSADLGGTNGPASGGKL